MKKIVTVMFSGLMVLALGCLVPVPAAEDFKIGYVDLQAFMGKSKKVQTAQQDLMKLVQGKQQDMERMRQEFQSMEQDLRKQGPLLSEVERNRKIAEMAKKKAEIELFEKQSQQELQNEERDLMQNLQKQLTQIVDKMRKEKKLTLIFNSAALVSVDQALDLTEPAAKEFDATATALKAGTKPGPAAPTAAPPAARAPAKPATPPGPAKQPATR